MTMTIRLARQDDLPVVHRLIHAAADWIHGRGYDQWPHESPTLGYERLGQQIERGETYLLIDRQEPVATIAVSAEGDPDFWSESELAESAVYLSKAAVAVNRRGQDIGSMMMRWVVDKAYRSGVRYARLDAWKTNPELQDYYRRRGWHYLRTVELPHRRSGALFERRADPDLEARAAIIQEPEPGTAAYISIYEEHLHGDALAQQIQEMESDA